MVYRPSAISLDLFSGVGICTVCFKIIQTLIFEVSSSNVLGSSWPKNGQHFKRFLSIPVTAIAMKQRRRSNSSAIPAKPVHSLPFTVKLFCRSISLAIALFSVSLLLFFTFNLPIYRRHYIAAAQST